MDQLLSAIAIVSDPTQNRDLQAQAIDYLNTIRTTPEQSWQLALQLFVATNPSDSTQHAHDPQIRAFALQIIDDLFNDRYAVKGYMEQEKPVEGGNLDRTRRVEPLDQATNDTLREAFTAYIRSEYAFGSAEAQAACSSSNFDSFGPRHIIRG